MALFGKARPAHRLAQISSLVAEGVEIVGDLRFEGGLRIDGSVRGHLHGHSREGAAPALLVLSQTGCIEGSVRCGHALINGRIDGDLEVEQFVELQPGARITGTLRYRQLQMDVGAVVQGRLVHADADADADADAEAVRAVVAEAHAAG